MKKYLFLGAFLFVFVFTSFASGLEPLNLTLYGSFSDGAYSYKSDFKLISQISAVKGFDGYDSLSPTHSKGNSSFSSVMPGNILLRIDAYDPEQSPLRRINLTFQTPSDKGIFNVSWKFSSIYYDIQMMYFGNDSSYTKNLSDWINIRGISSYTDYNLEGDAYIVLNVKYFKPASSIDEGNEKDNNESALKLAALISTTCNESILCEGWNVCQNLEVSFKEGIFSQKDYNFFKEECNFKGYDEESCGFQTRSCQLVDECAKNSINPKSSQACYFSFSLPCNDGIKNCHSGSCEVLIDCGGPCAPCPTCSDGIKNQGEEGVDCGGPCPDSCPKGFIERFKDMEGKQMLLIIFYILAAIIVVAVALILIYYIKKIKRQVNVEQYSWYNLR